jgi:hypothetical protein
MPTCALAGSSHRTVGPDLDAVCGDPAEQRPHVRRLGQPEAEVQELWQRVDLTRCRVQGEIEADCRPGVVPAGRSCR